MMTEQASSVATPPVFTLARTFAAPRALVWAAWTEAERLAAWFGPVGWALVPLAFDLRPGGAFHYAMRLADGNEMWGKWVFREIMPPDRLVFVSSFADADGATARAPFSADFPLEALGTVTFAERDGDTTVTLTSTPLTGKAAELAFFEGLFDSMRQGWGATLDQLATYLAAVPDTADELGEFTISRELAAPRELIFRAYLDPAQLVRFFAPRGLSIPLESVVIEPWVGGPFALTMVFDESGDEIPGSGHFTDLTPPERIAWQEEGNVAIHATITLDDLGNGRTLLTFHQTNVPAAYRGPEAVEGFSSSFDLLAEHLAALPR